MRRNTLILATCLAALLALVPMAVAAQDDGGESIAMDADALPDTDLEAVDPLAPRSVEGLTLDEFLWVARPIVIFADTAADPRFAEQLALLAQRPEPLLERDVVILVDTDPEARSAIRMALRPRGFSIVVIAKDGTVGLRRPAVRDVREIIRAIDNFQLRQEELRNNR